MIRTTIHVVGRDGVSIIEAPSLAPGQTLEFWNGPGDRVAYKVTDALLLREVKTSSHGHSSVEWSQVVTCEVAT